MATSAEKFGEMFPLIIKNAPKENGLVVGRAIGAAFAGNISQFDYKKVRGLPYHTDAL